MWCKCVCRGGGGELVLKGGIGGGVKTIPNVSPHANCQPTCQQPPPATHNMPFVLWLVPGALSSCADARKIERTRCCPSTKDALWSWWWGLSRGVGRGGGRGVQVPKHMHTPHAQAH